jgi:hypothetical protein
LVFTGYFSDPTTQFIKFNILKYKLLPIGNSEYNSVFSSVNIFPNPSSGLTTINFELKNPSQSVQILITDMSGKVISNQTTNPMNLSSGFDLDLSGLNSGIYFVNLQAEGSVYTAKLLVN